MCYKVLSADGAEIRRHDFVKFHEIRRTNRIDPGNGSRDNEKGF